MDLAHQLRQRPCPYCGETAHFANYYRKPRGYNNDFDNDYNIRFSLCCSKCRKRIPVLSTLFFGRFVYGTVFFIIISCFNNKNGYRYKMLAKIFKVSDRTLRRWKVWWETTFKNSSFWKDKKALFTKPPEIIPLEIIQEFTLFEKALAVFSHFNQWPILSRRRC